MRAWFAAVAAGVLSFGLSAAHASTVTLDYTAASSPFTSYEEDGFTTSVDIGVLRNGTFRAGDAYVAEFADATVTIARTDASAFSASSLDLTYWSPGGATATIQGVLPGGSLVSQVIAGITTLETFDLSPDFGNITALQFTQNAFSGPLGAFGFDNVVVGEVAPIPLPATGLLLLAAVGGIAVVRRRRD